MKKLILILFLNLILSCTSLEKKIISESLEGAWSKESEIIFKSGVANDTLTYDGVLNEIYAKNYYITLVNNVDLDSVTMEDKDLGFAESGQYEIQNDILVKKLMYGTAWIPNAIKNWKKPENDYLEAKFKVDISDDYFLKFIVMDSLGNGQADLMKKIK
jgi:hypothetical protein|tara:strand:- start:59 stop:535 length:477 start_codon:yes stop_codon:yes gene_type:complete